MRCLAAAGNYLSVSVNISPVNLLDPQFTTLVRDLLESHQVPAEALVLEITETTAIMHFDRSQSVIQELRDLGVVVSIDDFGAGFTSLAHLSKLAVKELKLDRVFIAALSGDHRDRALDLVRATIELGHALGLRIVAEGIEDSATLGLLSELGCDLGQGYYISTPMPADLLTLKPAESAKPSQPVAGLDARVARRLRSQVSTGWNARSMGSFGPASPPGTLAAWRPGARIAVYPGFSRSGGEVTSSPLPLWAEVASGSPGLRAISTTVARRLRKRVWNWRGITRICCLVNTGRQRRHARSRYWSHRIRRPRCRPAAHQGRAFGGRIRAHVRA